jgi:hypothetical protein
MWIDAMNAANYLGHNNWRLPTSDRCGQGTLGAVNCSGSEMGHLYYSELGGVANAVLSDTSKGPLVRRPPGRWEVAALFYSLIESAKLAGVDAYLRTAARHAIRAERITLPHELVAS